MPVNEVVERLVAGRALVGYVSDIEGNLAAWNKYLDTSAVLYRETHADHDHHVNVSSHASGTTTSDAHINRTAGSVAALRDGCHFVFGGDVCDRGNGDIRILQDLIHLKQKYPDRVHFIMGNRDVNKLRLPVALHAKVCASKPQAYWTTNTGDEGYEVNDLNHKMKWLLKNTMGSPFSFECRRQELQELALPHTDSDVTHSYLSLALPGGLLCKYLQYAKMAVVIEDVIFVHGALNEYYLGWIPPKHSESVYDVSQHSEMVSDPLLWMEKINDFAKGEIAAYVADIDEYLLKLTQFQGEDLSELLWDVVGGYGHDQPGSRLIQCGMGTLPDKSMNPSIIYASYLENGRPVTVSPRTYTWLATAHLHKVVVGHQPNADVPLVVNNYHHQNYISTISADSSYSKFTLYRKSDLKKSPAVSHLYHQHPASPAHASSSMAESKDDDNEWLSYDGFMKKHHADLYPAADSSPVFQADTRGFHCIAEVLLTFPSLPKVVNAALSSSGSASPPKRTILTSSIVSHGYTSQNLHFAYHSEQGADHMIGRKTSKGWYVKARGIFLQHSAEAKDHKATEGKHDHEEGEHFLLSFSEKFDFKHRLVSHVDLHKEFASTA